MPFEHLSRSDRRTMAKIAKEEAAKRPARLTEVPRSEWPPYPNPNRAPTHVWQSRKYLVQLFDEGKFAQRVDMRRMTVCRVTLADDGRWEDGLSWDELQDIKHEIGFGDWYGLEVYPRDCDTVNVANMRHLWLLETPLEIGWFTLSP